MSQRRRIAALALAALLGLVLTAAGPASAAGREPAVTPSAAAAPAALPQWTPHPTFLDTFECDCQVYDGCIGGYWYDYTFCQTGQTCTCRSQGIDYPDGYTCYSSLTAVCI